MSYDFSIDRIEIRNTRSRHEDTVYASISVAVAGRAPLTLAKKLGDHDNGSFDPGMVLSRVPIADRDVAVFTYIIVNSGRSEGSVVLNSISEAATTVARGGATAAAQVASDAAAGAVGAWVGSLLGSGVPIMGTINGAGLGALERHLLNTLIDVVNPNCDGPLASAVIPVSGNALRAKLEENQLFGQRDMNPGVNSPLGCGSNSQYSTTWSVKQSSPDHFYTTDLAERTNALGYTAQGTACFVMPFSPAEPIPLYRYWNGTDHFYTTSFDEGANVMNNFSYKGEGITGYLFSGTQPDTVPLYRMYNRNASDHFYTTSPSERDSAIQNLGYTDEGIAGHVYRAAAPGVVALYHMYSDSATDHFYTTVAQERDNTVNNHGYTDEGVACYIASCPPAGQQPLYRAFSLSSGDHFYTMDISDFNNATNNLDYRAERIAAYIQPNEQPGTVPFRRAYQPTTGDHFYTTSDSELQNAVANLGYQQEGIVGYVLRTMIIGSVPFYRAA